MKIIGITGGIGSGKTAVLNILKEDYGAFVMETDALAHHLMEPGQISYKDIVDEFGTDILTKDGIIDRQKLGQIVFNDESKLNTLNFITHPNVKKSILDSINEQRDGGCCLYVLEAALLIQDGYLDICDEMWFVYADIEKRIERLCKFRNFTRERALDVIRSQASDDYYQTNCTKKIDNSGDIDELRKQIGLAVKM